MKSMDAKLEPMCQHFYIPRRLFSSDKTYTEAALLATSRHIVVLAEPGAGKTELMRSLASQLGTAMMTANVFSHVGAASNDQPLVIDAFDELSKIDQAGIQKLLANVRKANPTHVIISSRSSEWDSSNTRAFEDFIGHVPLVSRLCDFDDQAQREIFENHVHNEDFSAFRNEVSRFDLEPLLPNPQFLKLFADAYVESNRRFVNKRSIFSHAVERLAKEANANVVRQKLPLSTSKKIDVSSEIFAKLLLAGSEGVCINEASEDRMHPLLGTLFSDSTSIASILATRLFRPGETPDHHVPVHKIVAEYCAASYLIKRIVDPQHNLSLTKCLAVIAPNATVRDELRGMLGWMASLGDKSVQEAAINLDPYAVLANGDPSQLERSSKKLLIRRLMEIERVDPYFRRGDSWRRFSVSGFFTQDVIEEIKPILTNPSEGHLRDLILELFETSTVSQHISSELRELSLSSTEDEHTRRLANRCLLHSSPAACRAYLPELVSEASETSLRIASEILEELGQYSLKFPEILSFFEKCATLYGSNPQSSDRVIGARYFVKHIVNTLDRDLVERLLDALANGMSCQCGKEYYRCDCRVGVSKVIGSLLDRYFLLTPPPYAPPRIWPWIENLVFHERRTSTQSKAVHVLETDEHLRRGIFTHVFRNLTDRKIIFETKTSKFGFRSHSGLGFFSRDLEFITNFAFEIDNVDLWASFIPTHHHYRDEHSHQVDARRRQARLQALSNPAFMSEWVKFNRDWNYTLRHDLTSNRKYTRIIKRNRSKQNDIHARNIAFVRENRDLVESGKHMGCLMRFAELTLVSPSKIETEFGDEKLVRTALRNCLDFISPQLPTLVQLAELQCASKGVKSEHILYASCLEIMRTKGDLAEVRTELLELLRTNVCLHYQAVTQDERSAFKHEIDKRLFPDATSAESFLRRYLEPQLANAECDRAEVRWLRQDPIFEASRRTLSIEWLERFADLAPEPLDSLFEIAAEYGDRAALQSIIRRRCSAILLPVDLEDENTRNKRAFWFMRAWYFLESPPDTCWRWISSDKDNIHLLRQKYDRISHNEHPYWPSMSASKAGAILDAFIEKWPKVHLPDQWGTGSPKEEDAYRFLTDVAWAIASDSPENAIPVLDQLISDERFSDMHANMRSIRAKQERSRSLRDFSPPRPEAVVRLIDNDDVVTVEGLRQLIVDEIRDYQRTIDGGEFDSVDRFYDSGSRRNEVSCTKIIAERLSLRLQPRGMIVTPEHQLNDQKRSDFTVTKMLEGERRLLVTEVKGQWHKDLYTAASAQLYERYAIHPDAEHQGIFLAIWFGAAETVAGKKRHAIKSAAMLERSIRESLSPELRRYIDVIVLDVSKPHQPHATS